MSCDDTVRVYITTVSSTLKVKKNQQKIKDILDVKKIPYEWIDISLNEQDKISMREKCSNNKAIPPQIFRGDTYIGDFDAFDNAVEGECVEEFLGINH